jgi:uncharacterized protein YraI
VTARQLTTVQDLHLRTQPDPNAPDAIRDPTPNDVTLKGAVVRVSVNGCTVNTDPGSGSEKALINIWCPVSYRNYEGWANAYFLATDEGRRLACVINSAAQGCLPLEPPPLHVALPPVTLSRTTDTVRPLRTVQDLHLRTQPDPNAPDAIRDPTPNDVMPKGAAARVSVNGCTIRIGSGSSAQKASIDTWCPVSYRNYEGWANAYYLATDDGQRLACVFNAAAQGCESAKYAEGPPELKLSERWAVIASRSELQDAISVAQDYKQDYPGALVVRSQNGQFAVIIGPIDVQQNPSFLTQLTDSNKIPKDAYYSAGSRFVAVVWAAAR